MYKFDVVYCALFRERFPRRKSDKGGKYLLHSFQKKATLKKRTLSMLLAVLLVFSALSIGLSVAVAADAQPRTYYFDTSNNLDWNPSGTGERLVATFTNASGAQVGGTVTLSGAGSNLFRVTAPANAESIQLYVVKNGFVMPESAPAANTRRVFFNNKPNWNQPYVYAYNGADDSNAKWHGEKMTQISGTKYWYYDVNVRFRYLIFNDGVTVNSIEGNGQTGDIDLTGVKDNPVFSKASGTSWDTAPYYKNYANVPLSTRPSGANEMYALDDGSVVFSKYAYTGTDPRTFTGGDTIYLYAPAWTDASKVTVTWDLNDPYRYPVTMTADTTYGAGFYKATVPGGAQIRFSYNKASSNATVYTSGSASNCYNMKNSANIWCRPETAVRGEVTDYTAPVESSGHNSTEAYWADAVYYDYLSDNELSYGWLNTRQAGTGFNGSDNDWYPFKKFNEQINAVAKADPGWSFPLYFGNFVGVYDAYGLNDVPSSRDDHNGPYSAMISGLTNFEYHVNNSNALKENHASVKGLAYASLNEDGNIQYADGRVMPYFDSTWLKDTKVNSRSIGTTVRSFFPFRQEDLGQGVTKYSFDSQNGKDNVFFNWSGSTPSSVGYGKGSGYGVDDGLQYFMYQTGSGKGIFPFNNRIGGNGGNNNLDYGFGIKMEMDFRVPAGGVLPNGNDVTFEYSGDDDLWVYLSEYADDGSLINSQLVLDLGGTHKQASGSINFRTMKATADYTAAATHDVNFKSDTIYFIDSENWGDVWIYAWEGSSNKWFHCGNVTINGQKYYTATVSQFGGYRNFKCTGGQNNWTHQSQSDAYIRSQFSNITYANNPNYVIPERNANGSVSLQNLSCGSSTTSFGFPSLGGTGSEGDIAATGAVQTLDPAKTYHMSVFYMERGMIESNCKIEFTMTPASNDLKVNKEIETADVNPGLRADVQQRSFDFTTSEGGVVDTTALYKLNGQSASSTVNRVTGVYKLSHGDTADFNNQYTTGSSLSVKEALPTKGVRFDSAGWEVINTDNGETIAEYNPGDASSSATATKAFLFSNNDHSYVNRQVNFVNTPQVQDMHISKGLVDENGQAVTDVTDEFEFRLLISLDGSDFSAKPDSFKAYPLRYTAHTEDGDTVLYTDADGKFRFLSGDSVTFSGLPVGATFALIESPAVGYMPYSVNGNRYSGTYTDILDGTPAEFTILNQQKPITTEMRIRKFITSDYEDAENPPRYISGDLFSFTAKGFGSDELSSLTYTGADGGEYHFIDASAMSKTVSTTDEHGDAYFKNDGGSDNFLKFAHTGAYLFKITESEEINCTDNYDGDIGEIVTFDSDFETDDTAFLAVFVVRPGDGTDLTVDAPVYYYYDDPSQPVTASLFTEENKITSDFPEFMNEYLPGEVEIHKTDGAGNDLPDVVFNVYKVNFDGDAESIKAENLAGTEISNEEGIVDLAGFALYEKDDDGNFFGDMGYQWYALEEVEEADGYAKSTIIKYFTLPMIDSETGKPTYKITFDYVNGAIKNPYTAGPGMAAVKNAGLGLVILACALLLAYVIFLRKKAYVPLHMKK